jgi:hypothetical protein
MVMGEGTMVWIILLVGILTFIGSIAIAVSFLIRLPATYFHPSHRRRFMDDYHWVIRACGVVLKNAIGVLLIALGIVLSLPGVPGQGLLMVLVGMMLVDFPGKRAIEYRIISHRAVLRLVNELRRRFSRPPLILP